MAETTEYLGLTRPTEADFFSVSHFNENMDTLDANAEATAAAAAALQQEIGTGLAEIRTDVDTANSSLNSISSKIGTSGDTGTSTLFGKLNSGGSVIKSIQRVVQNFSGSSKTASISIQAVNTAKCIVLFERLLDDSTVLREITYTLGASKLEATCNCSSSDSVKIGFWIVEFC